MTSPPSSSELVQAFFDDARAAFEPMVSAGTGRWGERLRQVTDHGLETAVPDKLEGLFIAECDFETSDLIGKISYGDREFLIETVVGPLGPSRPYGLWEWANALGAPDLVPRETQFVFQRERMRDIVVRMANAVLTLRVEIAGARPEVVERIERARAEVQADWQARSREWDHRHASAQADDAFRAKDWKRVIELLETIQDPLSPAESKKLAYARKQAADHRNGAAMPELP